MDTKMVVSGPRNKALDEVDRLPPDLRACAHEYGLPIVTVCMKHGVKKASAIHELVREIWTGARQTSQRRVPSSTLDWYFSQAGLDMNTATLLRLLDNQSLIIIPKFATREMIEASIKTIANFDLRLTKHEKHRMRLNAALIAGANHLLKWHQTKPERRLAETILSAGQEHDE